jgi:hypothetical protein
MSHEIIQEKKTVNLPWQLPSFFTSVYQIKAIFEYSLSSSSDAFPKHPFESFKAKRKLPKVKPPNSSTMASEKKSVTEELMLWRNPKLKPYYTHLDQNEESRLMRQLQHEKTDLLHEMPTEYKRGINSIFKILSSYSHSFIRQRDEARPRPLLLYYKRATYTSSYKNDITLITFATMDRLHLLKNLLLNWNGLISLSIYVKPSESAQKASSNLPFHSNELNVLDKILLSLSENSISKLSVHIVWGHEIVIVISLSMFILLFLLYIYI